MSTAVCQLMAGRLATYRVVVADDLTLGFIRLDVSDQKWVARTTGSEKSAASLRRSDNRAAAIGWLQQREPVPATTRRAAL